MTLLLDQRGVYVSITKEIAIAAAGNGWSGKNVMTLLLDRRSAFPDHRRGSDRSGRKR